MSNYSPTTNFAAKDSLSSGDPLKKIKGTEITAEFNAIATMSTTKADLSSPVFTGTPSAPTAAAGTNTTQLATTAFAYLAGANLITGLTPVNGWSLAAANKPALYVNSTERLRADGVELMLPGTGSALGWGSQFRAMIFGNQGGGYFGRTDTTQIGVAENMYNDGANWKYVASAATGTLACSGGALLFTTGPAGTAGNTVSLTTRFQVSNTGAMTLTTTVGANAVTVGDGTATSIWQTNGSSTVAWGTSSNHAIGLLTNGSVRIGVSNAGLVTINSGGSVAGNGLAVTGSALTVSKVVAFSATPTFDANNSNYFDFGTLTAAVTSMTINNPTAGQSIVIRLKQDGTGGRTVAVPSGAKVAGSTSGTLNQISLLSMVYNGTDSRWEGAFSAWV